MKLSDYEYFRTDNGVLKLMKFIRNVRVRFYFIPHALSMKATMLRNGHKLKVFNSVIKGISICVVNNFAWCEKPHKFFFHHYSVLKHIPLGISKWMIRSINSQIFLTTSIPYLSFEPRMIFASEMNRPPFKLAFFSAEIFLISPVFFKNSPALPAWDRFCSRFSPSTLIVTLHGTIFAFVNFIQFCLEFFSAHQTSSFHNRFLSVFERAYHSIALMSNEYCTKRRLELELSQPRLPGGF